MIYPGTKYAVGIVDAVIVTASPIAIGMVATEVESVALPPPRVSVIPVTVPPDSIKFPGTTAV